MLKRTIAFSNPYHLGVRYEQLVIRNKDTGFETTRSIEDLGMLVLDHPQITFTQQLFQWLAANNVGVVICDEKHHPASMLLHLDTHHIQAERFRAQVSVSEPAKKQLWQQTVKAKIRNQAAVLRCAGNEQEVKALENLANKVLSGDSDNKEAHAARIYFKALFGAEFLRDRFGPPPNPSLNYGYTIIRAAVARALCGSGLLVTLGIHHHNKYNHFALADDIMEPFRPFVDWLTYRQMQTDAMYHELCWERKILFLNLLENACLYKEEKSPLQVTMDYVSANLAKCFTGSSKKLEYPQLLL